MATSGIGAGLAGIGGVRAALGGRHGMSGGAGIGARLDAAAQEVSSGRRADPYAALGSRAGEAIGLRVAAERNTALLDANRVLEGTLGAVESALGSIRAAGQSVLEQMVAAIDAPVGDMSQLAPSARDALQTIVAHAAAKVGGGHPLSGVGLDRPPLAAFDAPAAPGATSPSAATKSIVGGGLADAADAAAKAADMRALFDGTHPDPTLSFDALFYTGDSARDAAGAPAEALSWPISETERLSLGVRADDPAMRDVLRGLAMLASAPPEEIADPGAYSTWMGEAAGALSAGLDGLLAAEAEVGTARGRLERTMESQERRSVFLATQSDALEGVDAFEAGTRLQALMGQIETSYAVTARLGQLSFLDYM